MKAIGVTTDSHSSITQSQAKELGIMVLPMPFYIGEECYYEDITLSREEFFQKLDSGARITTSQPSPADVMKLWEEAYKDRVFPAILAAADSVSDVPAGRCVLQDKIC